MPPTSRQGRKKGQAKGDGISSQNTTFENYLAARDGKFSQPELMRDELRNAVFLFTGARLQPTRADVDPEVMRDAGEVFGKRVIARLSAEALRKGDAAFFRKVAEVMDECRKFFSETQEAKQRLHADIYDFCSRLDKRGKPKPVTKDELMAFLRGRWGNLIDQMTRQVDRAIRQAGLKFAPRKPGPRARS
jgi:hypothetical protein